MYTIQRLPEIAPEGETLLGLARLCYTCGICVGDCPAARFSEDFNPRHIFLRVCLGLEEDLIGERSPIWKCTTCYTCYERCPAGVRPLEVILALRNVCYRRGKAPEVLGKVRDRVFESGATGRPGARVAGQREALGLPAITPGTGDSLEGLRLERG
jgi:heterodisulfide reductase subunit C